MRRTFSIQNIPRRGLYAGSFDPPSEGHKDIINRAASLCDKLYVGIGENPDKKLSLFSPFERIQLLKRITEHLTNVEVVQFQGLVVDFAQKNDIQFLIRGLRAYRDFEPEFQMALVNRKISGIE